MELLKDKNGKSINYNDLVMLNGQKYVLNKNEEVEIIKMMKYQGYLHLLESEIELVDSYKYASKKFPELYI